MNIEAKRFFSSPSPSYNCPSTVLLLRVTLLLVALEAIGAAWMVEQPISSLAWYHPRLREILRNFPKARLTFPRQDESNA